MSGRTTTVLSACSLVLAAVVAAEALYLWGVDDPAPSAARPVVVGDIEARSVVETAAQDAAAIFTVSWDDYDGHLDRATALDPTAPKYFHLAQAYLKSSDKPAASRSLAKARAKGLEPDRLHPLELTAYHRILAERFEHDHLAVDVHAAAEDLGLPRMKRVLDVLRHHRIVAKALRRRVAATEQRDRIGRLRRVEHDVLLRRFIG